MAFLERSKARLSQFALRCAGGWSDSGLCTCVLCACALKTGRSGTMGLCVDRGAGGWRRCGRDKGALGGPERSTAAVQSPVCPALHELCLRSCTLGPQSRQLRCSYPAPGGTGAWAMAGVRCSGAGTQVSRWCLTANVTPLPPCRPLSFSH